MLICYRKIKTKRKIPTGKLYSTNSACKNNKEIIILQGCNGIFSTRIHFLYLFI